MRLTVIAALLGLFAVDPVPPLNILDPLSKLGAVGGLITIAGYLLARTIPAMNRSHSESMRGHDSSIRDLSAVLTNMQTQQHDDQQQLNLTLQALRANCARETDR